MQAGESGTGPTGIVAYEAWLASTLRETEDRARWGAPMHAAPQRAVVELGSQERAAMAFARVVAALATEAHIEAALDLVARRSRV